jgi:hypothetical protein
MKSQKKTTSPKLPRKASKKAPSRRRVKKDVASAIPPFDHRAVEHGFIAEHPEAFDPFIGEYVVLEGTSIVAHGPVPAIIADEARALGIRVPYLLKVLPKRKPNEGYL